MATATSSSSPAPDDRANKRMKQEGDASEANEANGPPPRYPPGGGGPASYPPHNGPPPPPPHHMPGGYYGGPGYGPPPPHHWQGPGPYPPGRGMGSPDRQGWDNNGYRNSPPKQRKQRKDKDQPPPPHPQDPYYGPPPGPPHYQRPPPPGYPPYAGGPVYASQGTWTGSKTPPRLRHREYRDHDYMSRTSAEDDGAGSSAGGSTKDKGRGSYKCGRCGVPKKGHVCPYQPKLKRRPDEPPPQTRSAAVQVEMDEFMTIRRLNLQIQGFPESYATEPYMDQAPNMVVGESSIPPHDRVGDGALDDPVVN